MANLSVVGHGWWPWLGLLAPSRLILCFFSTFFQRDPPSPLQIERSDKMAN
jgi:hypothetical protein